MTPSTIAGITSSRSSSSSRSSASPPVSTSSPRLVDGMVDALLSDLRRLHRDTERQVVAQVDLGLDGHRGGEFQRLVALPLAQIEVRVADGLDAGLVDGAPVELGHEVIDGLVPDGLPADGALDH